jgi:small subunit ribosomal protein S11
MAKAKVKKTKRKSKVKREVKSGKVYISASFNNTLVTVTDENGGVLVWGSAGRSGFKGTRKSTPYAATTAVEQVVKNAKEDFGIREAEVYIKGPGAGRDASLRAIRAAGLKVALIADVTPIPHNGPRPKKKRRV